MSRTMQLCTHLKVKHIAEGKFTNLQLNVVTRHSKFHVKRAEKTAAVISKMMAKDMFPNSFAKHKSFQSTIKCVISEFTSAITSNWRNYMMIMPLGCAAG